MGFYDVEPVDVGTRETTEHGLAKTRAKARVFDFIFRGM